MSKHIKIYDELEQGSDEWLQARCGIVTSSQVSSIITPKTLKPCKTKSGDPTAFAYEIASQRITQYVEPSFCNDHMLRGHIDEVEAKIVYNERYGKVRTVGFITNDKWGFTLGFSPDGLVDPDGLLECKSRLQKFQIETIVKDEAPSEYSLQLQHGLLVSERKWIDYLSYCGGLPMLKKPVAPNKEIQEAIIEAAKVFEKSVEEVIARYNEKLAANHDRLTPTERKIYEEITI